MFINGKEVDMSTIEVDGIDPSDYPDFADAYISSAEFADGTALDDTELDELTDRCPELIGELAWDGCLTRADYNPYDD